MEIKTHFAPAEKSSSLDIILANKLLAAEASLLDILGAVSGITAILDENRQIVYANEDFLEVLGIRSLEPILGKRPGEAIAYINSGENEYGCGTTKACSACGAVNAILESQRTGQKSVRETRITTEADAKLKSWDLRVTSSPVKIRDRIFYVFTLQDISDEKRRQNLEKVFFHDILNSAGGLTGLLRLLKDSVDPGKEREIIDLSEQASSELLELIMSQRQIRAAENGDLVINNEQVSSIEILKSAVRNISHHDVAHNKRILIVDHSADANIYTDRILLKRVLINMLKNALEATDNEGTVVAEVENQPDLIRFRVKNESVMPKETQLQMFQRSFTTKGTGRGIGTYSIKLITENYLKGKAGFISTETDKTIFYVDIFRNTRD
jgi:signal transduction histidine kinase